MTLKHIICLDMDGTISDLYAVDNWLPKIRAEDPSPYIDAKPLCNMQELNTILSLLRKIGYEIQIITCLSKNATKEYKAEVRQAKKDWLAKYDLPYDHFHGIDYKTSKKEVLRRSVKSGDIAWLFDDEARHREHWTYGPAIDPTTENIIETLMALLPEDI